MIKKVVLITALLVFASACQSPKQTPDEDYNTLFPWEGISKPDPSLEDMNRTPCDPQQALSTFRYPGIELDEKRTYIITLTGLYRQGENDSRAIYTIRYIAADKTIRYATSDKTDKEASFYLEHNKPFEISFDTHSGYPLYLSVTGVAPRGAHIEAKITAHSNDGMIVLPEVSCSETQIKEGTNPMDNPFCEYIILP